MRALIVAVGVAAALVASAGCSDDDGKATEAPAGSTTTEATYIVPPIPGESVTEICEATKVITTADSQISALLLPVLGADDSPESDKAFIETLPKIAPIIEQARSGYDRLAAALPGELATDARSVGDATKTFYDGLSAATTIEEVQDAILKGSEPAASARVASAHVEATVKKTCNLSLYS